MNYDKEERDRKLREAADVEFRDSSKGWSDGAVSEEDRKSFTFVNSMREEQRMMNNVTSDMVLAVEAKESFEEYYAGFKFGFGSNWMKPIFKQYFWWGYFAGYKKATNK